MLVLVGVPITYHIFVFFNTDVEVLVAEHLYQVQTMIHFEAVGAIGAHEYEWDMGDGRHRKQSIPPLSYHYDTAGT